MNIKRGLKRIFLVLVPLWCIYLWGGWFLAYDREWRSLAGRTESEEQLNACRQGRGLPPRSHEEANGMMVATWGPQPALPAWLPGPIAHVLGCSGTRNDAECEAIHLDRVRAPQQAPKSLDECDRNYMAAEKAASDHFEKSVLSWKFGSTEDVLGELFLLVIALPCIFYFLVLWLLKGALWARAGFSGRT
ncbi:MAG: hypothetical protein ABSH50_28820 [Bryobacteraceae bacterium]|jgi:hypothetical protein